MLRLRSNIFETNSSSTHSFSVVLGDYTSIVCYSEEEQDDVYLSNDNVKEILSELLKRSGQ